MTIRNISAEEAKRGATPPIDPNKRQMRPQQIKVKGAHWKNSVYFDHMGLDLPEKVGPLSQVELSVLEKNERRSQVGPITRRLRARFDKWGAIDAP